MDYALLMRAQIVIMNDLFKAAQADGKRDFTEEEQAKYAAAETEFKKLKAGMEQEAALAAMEKDIPAPAPLAVKEPAANSGSQANQTVVVGDNLKNSKPYAELGEMLIDVVGVKANRPNSLDRLTQASLNTQTGADGEFLVPEEFIDNMLKQSDEESQIFRRTTALKMKKGNTANIPGVVEDSRADGSRYGGISMHWVLEGKEGTYSQPAFRNFAIKLAKIMGLVSITEEMLEDSTLLTSWRMHSFPSEMAFSIDQAIFDADGNGKPLGLMSSGALVTVPKETDQTADTIQYENVVKMWARMPPKRMPRAAWFCTLQALEQFPLMNLAVGTGGAPVFLPPNGAVDAPYSTLFGRPIVPIEQATALGDKGDIVLADMTDYMTITKKGMRTESSIHVDFDKDKTSFRFIRRINGAPYTQNKLQSRASSTFYTSPYITLAARE